MAIREFISGSKRNKLLRSSRPIEALEVRMLLSSYMFNDLTKFPLIDNNITMPTSPQGQVVIDSSGDVFGLTGAGGDNGTGYIYELKKGGTTPNTVASFPTSNTINLSRNPSGLVTDVQGDLYGFFQGDVPAIFELPKGGTTVNTVASLSPAGNVFGPGNILIDSSGNLYGTSQIGGTNNTGTIWELPAGATSITVLASFAADSNGNPNPDESLAIDTSGTLYGTTEGNGVDSFGSIFKLPSNTHTIQTLAAFSGSTGGQYPQSGLAIDSSGDLFGTTSGDLGSANPASGATIFELTKDATAIQTLATFGANNDAAGNLPVGPVTLDGADDLFGVATYGGTATPASGVVWELPVGTGMITALHSFDDQDGYGPNAGVAIDTSGDIFGVTELGGAAVGGGGGVLYELSPNVTPPPPTSSLATLLGGSLPTTSVIAGQKAKISQKLTLINTGTTPISGTVSVQLYLSTGATVNSSSIALSPAVFKRVNLKSHKEDVLSLNVKSIPTGTANGAYYVVAKVTDPSSNVIHAASGGTIAVAPAEVDIAGTFVKASPMVKAGKNLTLTFSVTEDGNVPVIGSLPIQIDLSTDDSDDQNIDLAQVAHPINVRPGKTIKITVHDSVGAVTSGAYFVFVKLDPNNTLSDVDLANNDFASAMAVVTVS